MAKSKSPEEDGEQNGWGIYTYFFILFSAAVAVFSLLIHFLTKKEDNGSWSLSKESGPKNPKKTWSKRLDNIKMPDESALSAYTLVAATGQKGTVVKHPDTLASDKDAIITPEQLKHYKWECQHHPDCKSIYLHHHEKEDIAAKHLAAKKAGHSSEHFSTTGYYVRLHKEYTGDVSADKKGYVYTTDPDKSEELQ